MTCAMYQASFVELHALVVLGVALLREKRTHQEAKMPESKKIQRGQDQDVLVLHQIARRLSLHSIGWENNRQTLRGLERHTAANKFAHYPHMRRPRDARASNHNMPMPRAARRALLDQDPTIASIFLCAAADTIL